MHYDLEEDESVRPIGANLITSWVLAAMLLAMTAFLAQFPESPEARPVAASRR